MLMFHLVSSSWSRDAIGAMHQFRNANVTRACVVGIRAILLAKRAANGKPPVSAAFTVIVRGPPMGTTEKVLTVANDGGTSQMTTRR